MLAICAAALLLGLPARAALVKVGPETTISLAGENLNAVIAYDVNSARGDNAVCYTIDMGAFDRVYCRLFNAMDQLQTPILQLDQASQRVQSLDVAIADDGKFYLAVLTLQGGQRHARISGWNNDGSALFTAVDIEAGVTGWLDVALAAGSSGPWIGATRVMPGIGDIEVSARRFSTAGAPLENRQVAFYVAPNLNLCGFDESSDIAVNRSGDVAVSWIKHNFFSACRGTVMTRTLRAGGVLSAERQLTTVVHDSMGRDASPNLRPHVAALDNSRFVLAWSNNVSSVSATIDQAASIIIPQSVVMPGAAFEFAANPINGDFAVVSKDSSGSCVLRAQLAIEGELTPVTRFDAGGCFNVDRHAMQFLPNGQLRVARSYFNHASLSRIDLPAQIEVNNVTVSEGDPGPGAPPSAAISVTLTRPNPNGEDVQLSYYTRSGTALAGQDYAHAQDVVVFSGASGETARSLLLPILPDTRYEDDEHFGLEFELPVNAVIRRGEERASVVILDDDPTPPITPDCTAGNPLECKTVQESLLGQSTEILVRLEMAEPVAANLQISYTTADGSALAGSDYLARSGSVQIIAGATTASIPLTVLGDKTPEDTETFHLHLTAPSGVQLVATDLVIHILDDAICYLEVAPASIVANSSGGDEEVTVTTRPGCAWSVSTPDSWIAINSPLDNIGPGSIDVSIANFDPPAGVFERSGSLVIMLDDPMQTVTVPVDQDGDCTFDVDEAMHHFDAVGGEAQFNVDASVSECAWTVSSPAPWITILSPLAPVFGDGLVRYRIDANAAGVNAAPGARAAVLLSEEFDHSVSQDGCSYALTPANFDADAAGDVAFVSALTAPSVCAWTAVSQASWLQVREDGPGTSSGSGNGMIEVYVDDNPTVVARTGSVVIGGRVLTINQEALACGYGLGSAQLIACPDGRAFALDIAAADGCQWSVHSDAAWVSVLEGGSGIGADQMAGLIDLNLSEFSRNATLQLRANNIGVADTSVLQEGFLTYEVFDAARPADWSYTPSAAWTIAAGNLVGQAAGQGTALALDQASTCSDCAIDADIAISTASSAPGDALTVVGWYRDNANHVGLAMDEFSNRWSLYQIINGSRSSVDVAVDKILPNTVYHTRLLFDGSTFTAELGGAPILQLPLQGEAPTGSAGLLLTGSNGRLGELRVSRMLSTTSADPEQIFRAGFEASEAPNNSQCQLLAQ